MTFGYYTNNLLEGMRFIVLKNYRTMRKHFKNVADSNAELMKNVQLK
jgi:hypothetical protein